MKKWINVNDKLPPAFEEVIFLAVNETGCTEIMIGHRDNNYWHHCCLFYSSKTLNDLVKVTHWMLLPELPK